MTANCNQKYSISYAPGTPQTYNISREPLDFRFHTSILLEQLSFIKSRGQVRLKSCNPTDALDIISNYLVDPSDLDEHIAAFRDIIKPFVENLGDPLKGTFFKEGGPANGLPFSTVPNAGLGYFNDWVRPTCSEMETNGVFDEGKHKTFRTQRSCIRALCTLIENFLSHVLAKSHKFIIIEM